MRMVQWVLSVEEARSRMLVHHFPVLLASGTSGIQELLEHVRCIQVDPLDPMGTNQDLVVAARVDDVVRGQVYQALFPNYAFEHFAKERCILPASAFPYYRDRLAQTGWWRMGEREDRVAPEILERVLEELRLRGPLSPDQFTDHGRVKPLDWNGWKGTSKATTMALEMLWTAGKVVVSGKLARSKLYDLPERALPKHWDLPAGPFERWAILDRVAAAGLLSRNAGAHWSTLSDLRKSKHLDELLQEGAVLDVRVEGSPRRYLTTPAFLEAKARTADARMRILGPLDPLLWDRELVRTLFDFHYTWEVYKPEAQRVWGWYVQPLLYEGQLVGRIEGRLKERQLVISKIWRERPFSAAVLDLCLQRHAAFCEAQSWTRPAVKDWLK